MLRFLYQANDANGKKTSGQVDAESIAAARTKLEASGNSDIEFFDDEFSARLRIKRDPVPGLDPKIAAELEIRIRKNVGVGPAIIATIKNNAGFIALALGMIGYGLFKNNLVTIVVGAVALVLLIGAFAYKRIPVYLYDQILRTMSFGEWDKASKLIDRLERKAISDVMRFDLAIRRACIEAKQGRLNEALASLEIWREKMRDPKGMFEGRLASVYLFARDSDGFIKLMREAHDVSPDDRSRTIDLALALARFGSVTEAALLIESVDTKDMPRAHLAFVNWVKGLIQLRKGNADAAVAELAHASSILVDSAANPVYWTTMALVTGALALAVARTGDVRRARQFIQPMLPIFRVYADRSLAMLVKHEVLNVGDGKADSESN